MRHILTLFHYYHRGGNCPVVPRTRISMVWASHQANHRPRPPFYVALWEGANHETRRTTKPIYGLPSSDRRIIRAKEPMGGAISTPCHLQPTRGLVYLAPHRYRCSQQPKERHYRLIAQSNPARLRNNPHSNIF